MTTLIEGTDPQAPEPEETTIGLSPRLSRTIAVVTLLTAVMFVAMAYGWITLHEQQWTNGCGPNFGSGALMRSLISGFGVVAALVMAASVGLLAWSSRTGAVIRRWFWLSVAELWIVSLVIAFVLTGGVDTLAYCTLG